MDVLYDREGTPLAFASERIFAVTKAKGLSASEDPRESFWIGKREFVSWGEGNRYPDEAVRIIGSTGVLSTAIGFKTRTSFGQGVVACLPEAGGRPLGADSTMAAAVTEANEWLQGYGARQFIACGFRDLFKFGNCFPLLYFNRDGSRVARLIMRNARHCRVSRDKGWLCVFPNFDSQMPDEGSAQVIRMLDEDDPFYDLEVMRERGELAGRVVAFPRIKNYYSNNDFYGIPDWDAAYRSGWVDVAKKIPRFLERSYANAMSLMWHIQIPASFWTERFPKNDYKTKEERQAAIDEYVDQLEENLCGDENVSKSLITSYTSGAGREADKWSIERLKNEIDASERLSTSAAANSEILFSMMINPSVLGAGMPGGAYAGGAGSGSDIRESFLVSVITTYIEKQQVLDPIRMMLEFNLGVGLELRYRETILTTLNTGQAVEEVES